MKVAAIIGHGELGRQVESLVLAQRRPDNFCFFDDAGHAANQENTFPFEACLDAKFSHAEFYVALGYKHLSRKLELIGQLLACQRNLPNLVHASCHSASDLQIGHGCIVYPMCNIDKGVAVGNGVILNNSCVVSHDCEIGDAVYVAPGAILCGRVRVGCLSFLGAGSLVVEDVCIGSEARVAIGTVVTQDVPNNASVIGNPMRVLTRSLRL